MIEQIFIIHLDRSPNRIKDLISQIKNFGLNYKIFPGFDGNIIKNPSFDLLKRSGGYGFNGKTQELTRTHIGCSLSHINILNTARSIGYENILILEDDAHLCSDFPDRLKILEREVPADWEHIYVGGIIWNNNYHLVNKKISEHLYLSSMVSGTHSYIVNSKSYKKISDHLSELSANVDGMMADLITKRKVKSYTFIPLMTYQKDMVSDIDGKFKEVKISRNYYKEQI